MSPISFETIAALRPALTDRQVVGGAAQSGDDFLDTAEIYSWYYAVAAAKAPRRILELGVRYGYALIAMSKGAQSAGSNPELFGVDAEADGLVTNAIALANLQRLDSPRAGIFELNTQDVRGTNNGLLGIGACDIVHIDGDHSIEGVEREIHIARIWSATDALLLIDDIDASHVRHAGEALAKRLGITPILLPTLHGLMVLDLGSRQG